MRLTNAISLVFLAAQVLADGSDWVANGGDFEHTGYKAQSLGFLRSLDIAWMYDTKYMTTDLGANILTFKSRIYYVTPAGVLHVIDSKTGYPLRRLNLDQTLTMPEFRAMAIEDVLGILYVSEVSRRMIYAVKLSDTNEYVMWIKSGCPNDVAASSKLGRLLAANYCSNRIQAYNSSTGEAIPNFNYQDTINAPILLSLYQDTRLLAISKSAGIQEFDATNSGSLLWNISIQGIERTNHSPVIAGSLVLVNNNGRISAVDIETKTIKWTMADLIEENCPDLSIAADLQFIYRQCPYRVYIYNMVTGQRERTTATTNSVVLTGRPLVLNDYFIVPAFKGFVVFDKASGNVSATYTSSDDFVGDIIFANGLLFSVNSRGMVYGFRASTSQAIPFVSPTNQPPSPVPVPVKSDGNLVLGAYLLILAMENAASFLQ